MLNFRTYPEKRYHRGQEVVIFSADVCGALECVSHPTLESKQEGATNLAKDWQMAENRCLCLKPL